jgi:hypothetical protein
MSTNPHHTDNSAEEDSKPAAIEQPISRQQQPQMDPDDNIEVGESSGPNYEDATLPLGATFDPPTVIRTIHSNDPADAFLFHVDDRALLVHDATIASPPYSKRDFTGTITIVDREHMTAQLEFWDHDGDQWRRLVRTAYFDEIINLSHIPLEDISGVRQIVQSLHDNQPIIPSIPRLGLTVDAHTQEFISQLPSSRSFTFNDSSIRTTLQTLSHQVGLFQSARLQLIRDTVMFVNRAYPEPPPSTSAPTFFDALRTLAQHTATINNDSAFLAFYHETSNLINRYFPDPTIRGHAVDTLVVLATFLHNSPGVIMEFLRSHSLSPRPTHSVAQYFLHTALTDESNHSSPVQTHPLAHDDVPTHPDEVTPRLDEVPTHVNEASPPQEPNVDPRLLAAHSTIAALHTLRDTQNLACESLRTSLSESNDTVLRLRTQLEAANASLNAERKRTQRLTLAISHINTQHSRPPKAFLEGLNPEILRYVHSSPVVSYLRYIATSFEQQSPHWQVLPPTLPEPTIHDVLSAFFNREHTPPHTNVSSHPITTAHTPQSPPHAPSLTTIPFPADMTPLGSPSYSPGMNTLLEIWAQLYRLLCPPNASADTYAFPHSFGRRYTDSMTPSQDFPKCCHILLMGLECIRLSASGFVRHTGSACSITDVSLFAKTLAHYCLFLKTKRSTHRGPLRLAFLLSRTSFGLLGLLSPPVFPRLDTAFLPYLLSIPYPPLAVLSSYLEPIATTSASSSLLPDFLKALLCPFPPSGSLPLLPTIPPSLPDLHLPPHDPPSTRKRRTSPTDSTEPPTKRPPPTGHV